MASSLAKLVSDAGRKCLSSLPIGGAAASTNTQIGVRSLSSAVSMSFQGRPQQKALTYVHDPYNQHQRQPLPPPQGLCRLPNCLFDQHRRLLSTSAPLFRVRLVRKTAMQQAERMKDLGTRGELSMTQAQELPALELKLSALADEEAKDSEDGVTTRLRRTALDWMPRPEDYETVYENGKKFKELPIIFLSAGKNNTKLSMTDARQVGKAYTTAGIEGFKGCKRGTNIAAQTAAMSFAKKLVRQSKVSHVRVVVKGIGPGRLSAIEGLVMGGLKVVSITDDTPLFGLDQGQGPGPRPRKVRRV